jgi:hypothetical protein
MPTHFEIEDRGLMVITITEPWSMADLIATYPAAEKHLNAINHPVFTLVDIRRMQTVPSGALAGRNSPYIVNARCQKVIVVGANPFAKKLTEVAFNITKLIQHAPAHSGLKVEFYTTMEQGRERIAALNKQHELTPAG